MTLPPHLGSLHGALRANPGLAVYLAVWSAFFGWFWLTAFSTSPAGGLVVHHPYLWADWPLHFTLVTAMVEGGGLPTENPILVGESWHYPFLADWLSAQLVRAGMALVPALVWPSLLACLATVWLLPHFFHVMLRDQSSAVIASWLFWCVGGLGWVVLWQQGELLSGADATNLPEHGIVMQSAISSLLIPQRSLTLGLPWLLLALAWIRQALERDRAGWRWLASAVMLGMLPIIHTHSFLAAFVILAGWMMIDLARRAATPRRDRLYRWLLLVGVTSLIAVPLLGWFIVSEVTAGFVRWQPGWAASELGQGWWAFWWQNWGLWPILAGLGAWLAWRRDGMVQVAWWMPFLLLFVLCNLWLFAPWWWDNAKLLIWVELALAGLVAGALLRLWRGGLMARVSANVLLVLLCASGVLASYALLRTDRVVLPLYSAEELALADWVKRHTPRTARLLTADQHHHWAYNLTGRATVMGYRGWLWSHGHDYRATEQAVQAMYQTAAPALLARYRVQYVVIGPQERRSLAANEAAFERLHRRVKQSAQYSIYQVLRYPDH